MCIEWNSSSIHRMSHESIELCQILHRVTFVTRGDGEGGSPGLVIMVRDSRSKSCGFKSRHCILDGHFFTYICCKNCIVCLKRPKINEKEAGVGPFKKTIGQG